MNSREKKHMHIHADKISFLYRINNQIIVPIYMLLRVRDGRECGGRFVLIVSKCGLIN